VAGVLKSWKRIVDEINPLWGSISPLIFDGENGEGG
jgi:hypothetical protein